MTYPLNTAVKATEQGTNRDTTVTEKSGEMVNQRWSQLAYRQELQEQHQSVQSLLIPGNCDSMRQQGYEI